MNPVRLKYYILLNMLLCGFAFCESAAAEKNALADSDNKSAIVKVNTHNGNVYFFTTDTPSAAIPLMRLYNSRNLYNGMFGWAWSCLFETYFEFTPEGNIVMHEYGGGDSTFFQRSDVTREDIEHAVDRIMKAMNQSGITELPEREALVGSPQKRIEYAQKNNVAFDNRSSESATWSANYNGVEQELVCVQGTWQRSRGSFLDFDTEQYIFDPDKKVGHLSVIARKGEAKITIKRDEKDPGLIIEIRNSRGAWLRFKYNDDATVAAVKSSEGSSVSYSYRKVPGSHAPLALLIEAKQSSRGIAKSYTYDYTQGGYVGDYNIKYIEEGGRQTFLKYDLTRDIVKEIQRPDGRKATYDYGSDPADPLHHYWVKVISSGKENYYEYWWSARPNGTRYISKNLERDAKGTTITETSPLGFRLSRRKQLRDGSEIRQQYALNRDLVMCVILKSSSSASPETINYTYDVHEKMRRIQHSNGSSFFIDYAPDGAFKSIQEDKADAPVLCFNAPKGRNNATTADTAAADKYAERIIKKVFSLIELTK